MTRIALPALLLACLLGAPALAQAPEQSPAPAEAERPATEDAKADDAEERPAAEPQAAGKPAPDEDPAPAPAEADTGAAEASGEAGAEPAPPPDPDYEPDEAGSPVAPPDAGPEDGELAVCEAALDALGARYERAEPLTGEGACGAPEPVTLSAVGGVELRPPVTVRCPVAEGLALWIQRVAAPMADLYLQSSLRAVLIGTGYQCRRRRGDDTAKYSEHAFANGVDVMGVVFEDGTPMPIQPREQTAEPERSYQAAIRGGACAFFSTVLGPMTNASHADHLHMDMAQRRGGYRLCE